MAKTKRRNILTISLSKHLNGEPISSLLEKDWAKTNEATRNNFNNLGFNVDPTDTARMLEDLGNELHRSTWDGILVGWCTRGYPQRTELFEEIMAVCLGEAKVQTDLRLIFNTGPDNLLEPVLRAFPDARE